MSKKTTTFISKCCSAPVDYEVKQPPWKVYVCSKCGGRNPLTSKDFMTAAREYE